MRNIYVAVDTIGKVNDMQWYEHLMGILAILFCACYWPVLAIVWSACPVAGRADKHIDKHWNGERLHETTTGTTESI